VAAGPLEVLEVQRGHAANGTRGAQAGGRQTGGAPEAAVEQTGEVPEAAVEQTADAPEAAVE